MGGKAVPGVRRATPELYERLKARMHDVMRRYFPRVDTPRELPGKPDYGDVDILYAPRKGDIIEDVIRPEFGDESASRAVRNGTLVSFPLENVQIDLIGETLENFDMAVAYFSWGDLGRALGVMARWYGFRWGHIAFSVPLNTRDLSRPALSWPHNSRDNGLINTDDWQNVLDVCQEPGKVFEYFGFDWARFQLGFATEAEILEWFVASPQFDIDIFIQSKTDSDEDVEGDEKVDVELVLASTSNYVSRCRSKKRDAYKRFLKWMAINAAGKHATATLVNPVEYFGIADKVEEKLNVERVASERKMKFSGHVLIKEGVSKYEVGKTMTWLADHYRRRPELPDSTMNEWIDASTEEEVLMWVRSALVVYRSERSPSTAEL